MMTGYHPKWTLRVTHIPTGIIVDRSSEFFRNQHLARESALKYLKSRLYMLNHQDDIDSQTVNVQLVYDLPDDNLYPQDLKPFQKPEQL